MPRAGTLAKKTETLIAEAAGILAAIHPATVRAVGYKLFVAGLLPDMSKGSTDRLSRALVAARERGTIPWPWIVDEHRAVERLPAWDDPEDFAATVQHSYRRDRWRDQPERLLIVSEKGTVAGVLRPVLDAFGVGFLVVHGFASATVVHDLAADSVDDDRPLTALYVGDRDPSGMYMSERDLPDRLARYGGDAAIERVALTEADAAGLPSFPTEAKRGDSRYRWYAERFGGRCWELDALDPRILRNRVTDAIADRIERETWARAGVAEAAELGSLNEVLAGWRDLVLSGLPDNSGVAS